MIIFLHESTFICKITYVIEIKSDYTSQKHFCIWIRSLNRLFPLKQQKNYICAGFVYKINLQNRLFFQKQQENILLL